MPRYEFSEGKSNKFWEIELTGNSFTTTYGRIGTEGQMSLKEYESETKARLEYDKLIAEKVKKGYQLVDGTASAAAPSPAATPTPGAAPTAVAAPSPAPAQVAEPKPEKPVKKPAAAVFDDEGDDEDEEAPQPAKPEPVAKSAAASGAATSKSGEPGARYFEFVDGKSSKFWEIQLEGSSFTTRYGKLGTEGQQSLKEWPSAEAARKEYDKLVAEKTKKGYVER